jgi:hypothetical protein
MQHLFASTTASSPPADHTRAARIAFVAAALCAMFIPALLPAAAARDAGIGSVKLTGQVVASLTVPTTFTSSMGVTTYGCQVGQESTQIIINVANTTVSLSGHKTAVKAIEFAVGVARNGDSEHITPTSNDVTFDLNVGAKTYSWTSTSGTVSTKAHGDGGSMHLSFIPTGKRPGGIALQSGGATGPLTISGTWTSCHPWP